VITGYAGFVRAHLENSGGQLANQGARTERTAANKAKKKAPVK
jgi:starvation-inducible DNA-binding protein